VESSFSPDEERFRAALRSFLARPLRVGWGTAPCPPPDTGIADRVLGLPR
jgi:hypothetical protein